MCLVVCVGTVASPYVTETPWNCSGCSNEKPKLSVVCWTLPSSIMLKKLSRSLVSVSFNNGSRSGVAGVCVTLKGSKLNWSAVLPD